MQDAESDFSGGHPDLSGNRFRFETLPWWKIPMTTIPMTTIPMMKMCTYGCWLTMSMMAYIDSSGNRFSPCGKGIWKLKHDFNSTTIWRVGPSLFLIHRIYITIFNLNIIYLKQKVNFYFSERNFVTGVFFQLPPLTSTTILARCSEQMNIWKLGIQVWPWLRCMHGVRQYIRRQGSQQQVNPRVAKGIR